MHIPRFKHLPIWIMLVFLLSLLGVQTAYAQSDHTVWIDDFEDVPDWKYLEFEPTIVQKDSGAGRWYNHVETIRIKKQFAQSVDVTDTTHMQF